MIWCAYFIIKFSEFSNCQVNFSEVSNVRELLEIYSGSTFSCILLSFNERLYLFNYWAVDAVSNVAIVRCYKLQEVTCFL